MFIIHDRVVSQIKLTAVSSLVRKFPQLLLALAVGALTVLYFTLLYFTLLYFTLLKRKETESLGRARLAACGHIITIIIMAVVHIWMPD